MPLLGSNTIEFWTASITSTFLNQTVNSFTEADSLIILSNRIDTARADAATIRYKELSATSIVVLRPDSDGTMEVHGQVCEFSSPEPWDAQLVEVGFTGSPPITSNKTASITAVDLADSFMHQCGWWKGNSGSLNKDDFGTGWFNTTTEVEVSSSLSDTLGGTAYGIFYVIESSDFITEYVTASKASGDTFQSVAMNLSGTFDEDQTFVHGTLESDVSDSPTGYDTVGFNLKLDSGGGGMTAERVANQSGENIDFHAWAIEINTTEGYVQTADVSFASSDTQKDTSFTLEAADTTQASIMLSGMLMRGHCTGKCADTSDDAKNSNASVEWITGPSVRLRRAGTPDETADYTIQVIEWDETPPAGGTSHSVSTSEILELTETDTRDVTKSLTETLEATETDARAVTKPFTEILEATESEVKDVTKGLSAILEATESDFRETAKNLSATLQISEVTAKDIALAFAATLQASEGEAKGVVKGPFVETLELTEQLNKLIHLQISQSLEITSSGDEKEIAKGITETLELSEVFDLVKTGDVVKAFSETLDITESISIAITKSLSETVEIVESDMRSIAIALAETFEITETERRITPIKGISATLEITESIVVSFVTPDANPLFLIGKSGTIEMNGTQGTIELDGEPR